MMREYYLQVLELAPGAGQKEIKSAYRRLSKKYHPDVNPSPDAVERFIEIDKAYDYLLNNKREPIFVAEAPDPAREWKERARRMAWEREQQRQALIGRIISYFNWIWYGVLIVNALIIIDLALPGVPVSQQVVRVADSDQDPSNRRDYRYDDIYFTNYFMRVEKQLIDWENPAYDFTVHRSRIFSGPKSVDVAMTAESLRIRPAAGIFNFWIYLVPLLLLLFCLYRFVPMSVENRLTLSIFMLVPMLLQLDVIIRYS